MILLCEWVTEEESSWIQPGDLLTDIVACLLILRSRLQNERAQIHEISFKCQCEEVVNFVCCKLDPFRGDMASKSHSRGFVAAAFFLDARCTHARAHTHTHTHTHTCTQACTRTHRRKRARARTHRHTHTHTWTQTQTHTHTHTHRAKHTLTHTHTHTHTAHHSHHYMRTQEKNLPAHHTQFHECDPCTRDGALGKLVQFAVSARSRPSPLDARIGPTPAGHVTRRAERASERFGNRKTCVGGRCGARVRWAKRKDLVPAESGSILRSFAASDPMC